MMEFEKLEEELGDLSEEKKKTKWLFMKEWRKRLYTEGGILSVDEYSLVLFPLSFTMFNLVYWFSVLNDSDRVPTAS